MAYDQEGMKQRATTGGKGNAKVQIYEHLDKEAFTVAWSPDGCKSQL